MRLFFHEIHGPLEIHNSFTAHQAINVYNIWGQNQWWLFHPFFLPFSSFADDENSHVHGVLTSDNLFDGTISTNVETFYVEPSRKYSKALNDAGIHSIVYKLSDVKSHPSLDTQHCASEKFHRKRMLNSYFGGERKRTKRWLPEEVGSYKSNPILLFMTSRNVLNTKFNSSSAKSSVILFHYSFFSGSQ